MNIQQSTDLIIFVTHVEAEDVFLKIWGQVDKNSATCVERMILPLVEQFARSQGCVGPQLANLRINALCCARFQNEGYYRAKVINIRADGMVVLQFIDYGNIEVLPPQEIHLLENIPGSESLQSFPPVAFDFTLMHILPINNVWDNKVIESIKKTLWYNEYKILIHSVVNNHRLIKLWYNNEDFSELLIKRHMAVRTTMQEMFRSKCVQQSQVPIYQQSKCLISNTCAMTPVHDGNEMHGFPRNVPSCCAAQKHMMQSSLQEALVFKSRVLDVPSKHDVYVSFVEDGPHKFSVQLQSTSQILSMLMREINSHPLEPLQEPPLPGSVCLGRYTQDKVLCRAVVMSVMENKCKLYYVDFGHTEILPYTDIFQLPPHFINPRVLSIRFTLSGVHELNVTDKMKEYFKQIVSGKLLVLHVRPPEGPPLVQYGDLYDDGKNIKDILRQAFPTLTIVSSVHSSFHSAYQEPKKLSKGVTEIVYISFVESCRKFFVQIENYISSLELIMNSLADFCTTAPTLSLAQLKIGLPCAALYDNQWYRAQILDINADNIKVLYVDYGNEEIVTLMSLRLIRDDLVKKLPAQAIKCTLNDWELLPCSEEIQNQFELLTLEKRLHLRVVDVTLDGIMVDLYGPEQNKNIKSQMLNLIENEEKIIRKSLNYQNVENQHSTKMASKIDQRSYIKLPMNLVQQWKNEINIKAIREDTNKWHKKNQSELKWAQMHDNVQEKNKFKTWKNESNESNNWNAKWNDKHDYNDSFKSGKGTKGSKNKIWGSVKSHSSDKNWSDRDSDTSSKGSGKHGKSSVNRGSSKHESISGRTQSNKFNDRNNDGNYKSGKRETNSNSYHGNKIKERKGQGYRLTQNKSDIVNFVFGEEEQKRNTMKSKTEFHIVRPVVTIGTRKTCEVVFTNSLSDFFIQFNDYTALDSMMERIALIYETGGELIKKSDALCGTYCIAQYSDLKWYRAVIKSTEENNAIIQFIDYGNTETVELNKIKSMQKEFLELPIQAVHCKLFGIKNNLDTDKTRIFEHTVFRKILEAEFITEENDIYSILLKEAIDPTNTYINQEFCENIDLVKAKEEIMSNRITTFNITQFNKPDYIPLDAKWTTISYTPETRKDVIITWFINPNNFYCQILDNENEFRTMMNEIQKIYIDREPVSHTLQVGSPVIAIFSDDGALYRAEVIELNKLNGHLIQYIDFGNSAIVDPQNIYAVERKLMHLPKQAFQCSLFNIAPLSGLDWSEVNTEAIDNCFNAENYECFFHNIKNNKYLISLISNGKDVANMLVEQNLASFNSKTQINADVEDNTSTPISYDIETVDINLLKGQTLRAKISSVDLSASKFYIQIPSATKCENIINTYMAGKDPEVMQRLSIHEICLGTGCLVCSNGVWRRAVISSHSQSTGCYVKFIDTGACDEIFSNSILALPGELSVMQNQAIECILLNKTDYSILEYYVGEEMIIHVDEIDNNRFIVKVFRENGMEIDAGDFYELVSPICPMLILSSTHKVSVSYADHSANIWLKRNAEHTLQKHLTEALDQYYSNPESYFNQKLLYPKPDILCAVKGLDGHWYRAKILTCDPETYVNFIDYGCNEKIKNSDIRLRQLAPHFHTPYQLAINASLPVVLNGTVAEQLDILKNHLFNKDLTAVFHYIDKKWIVELLHDGEKISDKFRSLNLTSEQKIPGMKEPQIHNMTIGCKYNVSVSHMDSPSQFWLQHADDATDLFNNQNALQDQVSTFLEIDGILEEGSLCVAVYTIDNLWYRAQVLDADEDITTVRFIDYGNTDVIDNKSGNIRQIPDSWREIKEYAVKCRLDVIPVDSEDWNVTTCEKFENLITSAKSLQALVIANSVPKRVDLLIDDKSVSEALVGNHHAVKIHTEEELIDEIIDLELDPYSAFVSHINSPNEFWVQEEKSVGDLEIMTDRFIVAHMFPKVDEIKENLLCVAKYPDDECWYRARVVSHSDNAIRVIYIDYGNSATSNEIRAIPPDLADIPPLSRKCRLVMPEGITEWSEKACEEFITLAADGATIFLLDVIEEDETSLVKLTLDGKNVTDILANFCERYLPIIEERLPPLGEENSPNVFVSRINSPDEFWIQTETSETDLDTMFEKLEAAPSFLPLSTFEIGTICAAKYSEDGQWYRAQILSHSEEGTKVLYIDYGNTEITNETRILPTDIINIPPLAKCCALQKPDNIIFWPSGACKLFKELATEETMFQFEILDNRYPVCVKLNLNGRDVVDILMENISEDATIEKENLYNDINDESNAETEETKVNETKKEEQDEDMNRFKEYTENQNQEIKENTDNSYLDTNYAVELTVDEIVQNMKVDEQEEDEDTFNSHNHTIEMSDKNNSDETMESFNELETQTEIETFSDKNEIKEIETLKGDNKTHTEIKDVNDEVSSTTIKEVAEDFKQLETQVETEIYSHKNEMKEIDTEKNKIHAEIKDVNEENLSITIKEIAEDFKQLETQAETEICSHKNEMKEIDIEKNKIHAEIKDVNEENLSITIKEIAEDFKQLEIQVETGSYNYENETQAIEIDTEKNKIKGEIEGVNEKVSLNTTEEVPLNTILDSPGIKNELEDLTKKQDIDEIEIYESSIDENKEYDKDCITQDTNEANADVTDPKNCSDINSVNEKVSSNLNSTEITSNESKVTDIKNDNPIIIVTVYEEGKRNDNIEKFLHLENAPTTSE
ncbi:tudor domain-containing 6-like isoform X3 [Frieseomelitta varia]|uniref:tudor domain-containing 6-like isoform X3 n=1 Tax=Frieseomelitta varia TaxID=561572 RepID=UPI001CB6872F|nr:tudor domain-containing 6-like isoform X3 [Frieseomelitta varia]